MTPPGGNGLRQGNVRFHFRYYQIVISDIFLAALWSVDGRGQEEA